MGRYRNLVNFSSQLKFRSFVTTVSEPSPAFL